MRKAIDMKYEKEDNINCFTSSNSVMKLFYLFCFFFLIENKCIEYTQHIKCKISCEASQLPF